MRELSDRLQTLFLILNEFKQLINFNSPLNGYALIVVAPILITLDFSIVILLFLYKISLAISIDRELNADQNYMLLLFLLLLLLSSSSSSLLLLLLKNLNKKLPKKGDMINVMRYISREKKIVAFKNL